LINGDLGVYRKLMNKISLAAANIFDVWICDERTHHGGDLIFVSVIPYLAA
jgi:hypothetical protein